MPKICVSVTEEDREGILRQAEKICDAQADLVEWRADWFADAFREAALVETLVLLREVLQEMPLLFTFRSLPEGGHQAIEPERYIALNQAVMQAGCADLIDIEAFMKGIDAKELIASAHGHGVAAAASFHDFQKTPPKEELKERLCAMHALGADLVKLAVMPQGRRDVLALLLATEEARREHPKMLPVTMSMAGEGLISRLCGEVFGSVLTFGCVGKPSAPGQIEAGRLRDALALLHENLSI